jgi:hypothetical protein
MIANCNMGQMVVITILVMILYVCYLSTTSAKLLAKKVDTLETKLDTLSECQKEHGETLVKTMSQEADLVNLLKQDFLNNNLRKSKVELEEDSESDSDGEGDDHVPGPDDSIVTPGASRACAA